MNQGKGEQLCPPSQEDDDDDDDDDDDFVDPPLQQLRTRFPTKRLTDFVSGLNNTQKACLNSIGFGSVLKLKIDTFSKSLAFWVVGNYNPDTNSICFYNKTIKVTKERVNKIYRIPMGDEEMKVTNNKKNKKMVELWKSQFPTSLKRPRLTHILQKLEKTKKSDDQFVLNFLVLFMNVMVQSTPMGDENKQFLKYIPNIESVKDLDWCGLVMTSLKSSKKVWAPNDKKSFYTGPALFLTINNEPVNIPRPSIAYWTEKLLSDRESKELEMGGYGNATVSTTDLIASSSRQAQGIDEAVLEGNESESGDVDEQARKLEKFLWEINFNFKEVAKAKKTLKRLLELGMKEYPESNELKEQIAKHISEFGWDERPEGDDESNEGDKTPIHDPSHTSVTTPGGQDSIPKENNADKGKQIINEGCVEGAEEGDEEDSVPTMTQLLTPVVFDNLLADSLAKRSGSRSLQLGFKTPEVVQMMQDDIDVNDDEIIDVFLPVLKSEHFYLIVFNMKRIECVVIDNSWVDVPMEAKYGTVPVDMVDLFTRYLTTRIHPKANKVKNVIPYRFFMSWMTKKNKVDCAVFVMRHMETYKGEKMEKWTASLEMECDSLQEQLNELRWKYVTKMPLSDMNLLKDYVEGKMDSNVNIPEHIRKKYGKKAHLEKIELRLKTLS
ncbi:hypothetical protein LXL04_033968 [Taraxacum kok-saghyz]